jgi:peptidoglycan hydrolase CwlO-like protein
MSAQLRVRPKGQRALMELQALFIICFVAISCLTGCDPLVRESEVPRIAQSVAQDAVYPVQKKVDELEAELGALRAKVDDLESEKDALSSDVDELKRKIDFDCHCH